MANDAWTIKRCLDWTRGYLGEHGDERPRLSAEWLLSSVTGLTRTELYMKYDEPLSPDELARMHHAVARRATGEPLQYIAGETSFRTITVACEPGVLIPRPETEVLVEEVLSYLDREVLGSGSGSAARRRVTLPWNAEVEEARKAEEAQAAKAMAGAAGVTGAAASGEAVGADMADAATVEEADIAGEAGAAGEGAPADGDARGFANGSGARVFGAATDDSFVPVDDDAPGAGAVGTGGHGDGGAEVAPVDGPAEGLKAAGDASDSQPVARTARVLEVGCGTGCISLSLATERPGRVTCIATDIEPKAVALAERNRETLGLSAEEVEFREGNLVAPLDRQTEWGTFDVLVSNPPYVPTSVMATLPREVAAFEPALALDGGEDGLAIFRRLLNAAPYMLHEGGLLACELFEESLDTAKVLCEQAGMGDVRVAKDLAGRPRIILARVVEAKRYQPQRA